MHREAPERQRPRISRVMAGILVTAALMVSSSATPAQAQTLGCSVVPSEWEAVQQGLSYLFLGACHIHDMCYRTCNPPDGPYLGWGWKSTCDVVFLGNMYGACGVWSNILNFPNSLWNTRSEFRNECEEVAYFGYLLVTVWYQAYLTQQCISCNRWACDRGGGGFSAYLCSRRCGYDVCDIQPWLPECNMCPITLDLNGNGLKLSGLQPPSSFDLDGDGSPDYSSWTRFQTKDGFLVLDRNGNGTIDDGRELFGNATPFLLRAGIALHGYEALAEFDDVRLGGNANGEIDAGDRIFEHLQVWLDTNRDNVSQPEELLTLVEVDLESLSLAFYFDGSVDQWGNELRWRSQINFSDGGSSEAIDVFFKRQEAQGGSNSTASGSGGSGQQD